LILILLRMIYWASRTFLVRFLKDLFFSFF
jgi:hypothetical protein